MWLKMLGSVLVIGATTWMGLQIAYKYQQRPLQLREIQSGLQMLETEIHYGLTPLPKALEKIALSHQGHVGNFFAFVRRNLVHEPGITAREAWYKAIDELWDQFALTDTDRGILINFGSTLGISDRHDQIKHVKLTMTQLVNAETKAWAAKEKNERMFRTLGFLGGLAIVILLF